MTAALRQRWRDAPHVQQANFFEFLIERLIQACCLPGSTAIDGGANYGAHTVTMLQAVGETGRVIAVEPDPTCVAALQRIPSPWLFIEEMALSDHDGVGQFHIANEG